MSIYNPGLRTSGAPNVDPEVIHAVMAALDQMTKRAEPGAFEGQEALAEWAAQCARLVGYGDDCDTCSRRAGTPAEALAARRWPVGGVVEPSDDPGASGGRLVASYRCHVCGNVWNTGWAVDAPWLS